MKFLMISLFLFSHVALASGKLSLEPSYDPVQDHSHLTFGLGVYEVISDGVAYSSWTGFGDSYDVDSAYKDWYTSKHQIDFADKNGLVFSPGVRISYLDHDFDNATPKKIIPEVYGKVSITLW